jgi:hypothetical protein
MGSFFYMEINPPLLLHIETDRSDPPLHCRCATLAFPPRHNEFEPWAPDRYNWDLGPTAGDEEGVAAAEPTDPMDGLGGGDDPVDEEPLDDPGDLADIGEIVPPISDDQC